MDSLGVKQDQYTGDSKDDYPIMFSTFPFSRGRVLSE